MSDNSLSAGGFFRKSGSTATLGFGRTDSRSKTPPTNRRTSLSSSTSADSQSNVTSIQSDPSKSPGTSQSNVIGSPFGGRHNTLHQCSAQEVSSGIIPTNGLPHPEGIGGRGLRSPSVGQSNTMQSQAPTPASSGGGITNVVTNFYRGTLGKKSSNGLRGQLVEAPDDMERGDPVHAEALRKRLSTLTRTSSSSQYSGEHVHEGAVAPDDRIGPLNENERQEMLDLSSKFLAELEADYQKEIKMSEGTIAMLRAEEISRKNLQSDLNMAKDNNNTRRMAYLQDRLNEINGRLADLQHQANDAKTRIKELQEDIEITQGTTTILQRQLGLSPSDHHSATQLPSRPVAPTPGFFPGGDVPSITPKSPDEKRRSRASSLGERWAKTIASSSWGQTEGSPNSSPSNSPRVHSKFSAAGSTSGMSNAGSLKSPMSTPPSSPPSLRAAGSQSGGVSPLSPQAQRGGVMDRLKKLTSDSAQH